MGESLKSFTETMNQSPRFLCRTLSAVAARGRGEPSDFREIDALGKAFGRFFVESLCFVGRSALFVELANDNRPMHIVDCEVEGVARTDFPCWFDVLSVQSDMAGDDGCGCERTSLVKPRGPKPFVNTLSG